MILNNRRRYIRSRKAVEPMHRMNVYIEVSAWKKADMMAGGLSLGAFVQELINREWCRREKRMVQQQESSLITNTTVQ